MQNSGLQMLHLATIVCKRDSSSTISNLDLSSNLRLLSRKLVIPNLKSTMPTRPILKRPVVH